MNRRPILTLAVVLMLSNYSVSQVIAQGVVQGTAANNSVPLGYPVFIGGWDGTLVRALKTDSTGQLYIANPGSGGSGSTSTTTLPASPPSNAPGTTGVSLYSSADGSLRTFVTNWPSTWAITAAALPLPAGAATDATQTNGTQKTQIVSSGGNAAAIDSAGNVQTKGGVTEQSGLTCTGVNSDLLPSFDCNPLGYKSGCLQLLTNAGTITVQGSNDNSTFSTVVVYAVTNTTISPNITTTGFVQFAITYRYLRIRQTAGAGTSTGILELYTTPFVAPTTSNVAATQSGVYTVQQGTSPSSIPWFFTSGGTLTTAIAAGAASNTVVRGSAGHIMRVLVTTTGTNPMLIYDNATTNTGTVIGALPASPAVGSVYDFSMPAAAGITVAGNAANPAVTISSSP